MITIELARAVHAEHLATAQRVNRHPMRRRRLRQPSWARRNATASAHALVAAASS
jgi:hypothetical protein